MTGLEIEITQSEEDTNLAIQMEDNYPGIHRKAIWEKVIFPRALSLKEIASDIQQPFMEKKYKKMLNSFKEKIENPEKEVYVDKVAGKVGISTPTEIKPLGELEYGFYVDLVRNGISLETGEKFGFQYIRTHGTW